MHSEEALPSLIKNKIQIMVNIISIYPRKKLPKILEFKDIQRQHNITT